MSRCRRARFFPKPGRARPLNKLVAGAALAGLLAIGALAITLRGPIGATEEPRGQRFGLMTSLPIYRAPQANVAAMLEQSEAQPHWLRAAVEEHNMLDPLDLLDAKRLADIDTLLLIQPHALTPAENVALDSWVRAGGTALLVTDPMLISEPQFALSDPRNPQAISVSGPIEARWGLSLAPGKSGDGREQIVDVGGASLPVTLGGRLAKIPPAGGDSADCTLTAEGLVATCTIERGRVVVVADATIFERAPASPEKVRALWSLLGMVRDAPGD